MKYQGEQSFEVGMTLIEIAECVLHFNAENFVEYNLMTRQELGSKLFAPLEYGSGVDSKMVAKIWKVTENMDQGGYRTLNNLLINHAYFLVPPPPPPGGGDDG